MEVVECRYSALCIRRALRMKLTPWPRALQRPTGHVYPEVLPSYSDTCTCRSPCGEGPDRDLQNWQLVPSSESNGLGPWMEGVQCQVCLARPVGHGYGGPVCEAQCVRVRAGNARGTQAGARCAGQRDALRIHGGDPRVCPCWWSRQS
jgi:hypothetical protein